MTEKDIYKRVGGVEYVSNPHALAKPGLAVRILHYRLVEELEITSVTSLTKVKAGKR